MFAFEANQVSNSDSLEPVVFNSLTINFFLIDYDIVYTDKIYFLLCTGIGTYWKGFQHIPIIIPGKFLQRT